MRFELDLASHNYRTTKMVRRCLAGLAVSLVGLLIFNGFRYENETHQVQELKNSLEQRAGAMAKPMQASELAELKKQVHSANALLLHRSFSLVQLLNDIEQAVPEGITLQRLQISASPSEIVMSGRMGRFQSLTILTDSLQARKRFADIVLTREDETLDGNVTFQLKFHDRRTDGTL